jgi:hypothetical protein
VQRFNTDYVIITVASMLFSAFEIWYVDVPEVRRSVLAGRPGKAAGA